MVCGWGGADSSELHLGNRLAHALNKVMCTIYLVNHLWLGGEYPQVMIVTGIFSGLTVNYMQELRPLQTLNPISDLDNVWAASQECLGK